MTKPLFSDFSAVTSKQWKQKIQVDLKGADYNETLVWNTDEGIDVKPFYHADEFNTTPTPTPVKNTTWKIGQTISVTDAKSANSKALDAINRGAESICFVIHSEDINIQELVNTIDFETTEVRLKLGFLSSDFVAMNAAVTSSGLGFKFESDIINNLVSTGNWHSNLNEDHKHWENSVKSTFQLYINLQTYQNSGASITQQLAYALAHANEYANHLDTVLNSDEKLGLKVTFEVAVGTNYFFEIAKLRALRQLWATLASEYGINSECRIIATPTKRNKTLYDYNTNMLRTTTECMSAVLGGADVVSNLPYDVLYHNPNEFGDRISRNQLLVLKHESYFDKVSNPSDGSYYIESLTEQLANNALDIFKSIEQGGGFLKQLKEGLIQKKIKASAQKEQAQFNSSELVLLGTNKHPNPNDKIKHDLELNPFIEKRSVKTLIEPIIEKRLAESVEQERLKNE